VVDGGKERPDDHPVGRVRQSAVDLLRVSCWSASLQTLSLGESCDGGRGGKKHLNK